MKSNTLPPVQTGNVAEAPEDEPPVARDIVTGEFKAQVKHRAKEVPMTTYIGTSN